jgi:hypothetical protein
VLAAFVNGNRQGRNFRLRMLVHGVKQGRSFGTKPGWVGRILLVASGNCFARNQLNGRPNGKIAVWRISLFSSIASGLYKLLKGCREFGNAMLSKHTANIYLMI